MKSEERLSSESQWSDAWNAQGIQLKRFRPSRPEFRDLHNLFKRHLPTEGSIKFLEIGCYPGRYMLYFAEQFAYKVNGLEYVGWCAEETERMLTRMGVAAQVFPGDFFDFIPERAGDRWDVVASFGFVEHFENTADVVRRHLALTRPGGYVVIVVPNHSGVYGSLMERIDKERFAMHNLMDYACLHSAILECGGDVVEGGYYGHFGLWNCLLYDRARAAGRAAFYAIRGPMLALEMAGQALPNSRALSPIIAAIVRKPL